MKTIKFYSVQDNYGCFSNFADYPFSLNGKLWPTVEHFFQAMKYDSVKQQEAIRKKKNPFEAARAGRNRRVKIKRNWESTKESIMYEAVYNKFNQHEELKIILLSTGDSKIVEDSTSDYYWGCGASGKGKNRLGDILMRVRGRLSNEKDIHI